MTDERPILATQEHKPDSKGGPVVYSLVSKRADEMPEYSEVGEGQLMFSITKSRPNSGPGEWHKVGTYEEALHLFFNKVIGVNPMEVPDIGITGDWSISDDVNREEEVDAITVRRAGAAIAKKSRRGMGKEVFHPMIKEDIGLVMYHGSNDYDYPAFYLKTEEQNYLYFQDRWEDYFVTIKR